MSCSECFTSFGCHKPEPQNSGQSNEIQAKVTAINVTMDSLNLSPPNSSPLDLSLNSATLPTLGSDNSSDDPSHLSQSLTLDPDGISYAVKFKAEQLADVH